MGISGEEKWEAGEVGRRSRHGGGGGGGDLYVCVACICICIDEGLYSFMAGGIWQAYGDGDGKLRMKLNERANGWTDG